MKINYLFIYNKMINIWKKRKSKKSEKHYYINTLTNESKWTVPNKDGILREVKESNNTFIIYIPDVYLNKHNSDYSLECAPKIASMVVPETSGANTSQFAEHVFGFIVFFERKTKMRGGMLPLVKIPYLNIEITHVLARSDKDNEYYFKEVPSLEHIHRLWQSSDNYVKLLRHYHQTETSPDEFCELHKDMFDGCRIEHTLFITEKANDGASALLIESNWKKGNIIIDIDGIMSGNTPKFSRLIGEFLINPEHRRHTFLNDYEGLTDIESIEFNKTIFNSMFVISSRIMHSAEIAIREIEKSLRNSKTPFIDSIHMYYQNNCHRLGGPYSKGAYSNAETHISDFEKLSKDEPFTSEQGGTLSCWITLFQLTGAISYEEYLELNKDIEKDSDLLNKHDIDIKYIMIILKKVLPNGHQHYREELAKVKCITKRKFVHTDLKLPFFKK